MDYRADFDKIHERLNSVDVTLAKQSVLLEEHIKRTNLLEAKLEPVEKHVSHVEGVIKFLLFIAAFGSILAIIASKL